jgi:uncharacterized membrane protein YecN with MAPEG domain
MYPLNVIPIYAALLALLFLLLSVLVIARRRRLSIGFGAGADETLVRLVRIHANFAEYVPFTVLLLALAEARGASAFWLNLGGIALIAGRLAHALGLARAETDGVGRVVGMSLSQASLMLAILLILIRS